MTLGAALLACAAWVAPSTMDAIVRVESSGYPWAVHVNGLTRVQPHATTLGDAIEITQRYLALGYSVDLGLGQLNSRHLGALGYSLADAFDPCKNLAASGLVLSGFYSQAVRQFGEGQQALLAALSGYNSGSLTKGFANGYVRRYYVNAPLVATLTVKASSPPLFITAVYDRPGYSLEIH